MKFILSFIVSALLASSLFGQVFTTPLEEIIQPRRAAVVDSLTYELTYRITGGGWVPLTNPPGSQHYHAKIDVHLVRADGTKEFIQTVDGTYSNDGCCDNPAVWVRKALEKSENQRRLLQPVWIFEDNDFITVSTNGYVMTHEIFKDLVTTTSTNWVRVPNRDAFEVGLIEETTEAILLWKGKTNRFVLESKTVGITPERPKIVWGLNIPNKFETLRVDELLIK